MTEITVYYNPHCSKCRQAVALLSERGIEPERREYLKTAPDRVELEGLMTLLGTDDPRSFVRSKESVFAELGLADADRDAVLDAITNHPTLLERPIVVRGDRAVVARPPELLLELLDE